MFWRLNVCGLIEGANTTKIHSFASLYLRGSASVSERLRMPAQHHQPKLTGQSVPLQHVNVATHMRVLLFLATTLVSMVSSTLTPEDVLIPSLRPSVESNLDAASLHEDAVQYYQPLGSLPAPDAILRDSQDHVVRSFDVFDTLIARSVSHPTDIFRIVQQRLGLPQDYATLRQVAEAQSPANESRWEATFDLLQRHYGWDDTQRSAAQAGEIQAEHDVLIPVTRNLARVRPNDLIISDMYLPYPVIHSLLRAAGLSSRFYLFVSVSGKHEGTAWRQLLSQDWHITHHLGDNYHSDVVQARAAGIFAEHTAETAPTPAETALLATPVWEAHGQRLRRVRLDNPYWLDAAAQHADGALHGGVPGYGNTQALAAAEVQAQAWDEYTRIFLPFCVYAARRIDERMQSEGLHRLLFIARDGTVLRAVFDALYGWRGYSTANLWSSRLLNDQATAELNCSAPSGSASGATSPEVCGSSPYYSYLRRMNYAPNATLIVDLNGKFKSGRALFRRVAADAASSGSASTCTDSCIGDAKLSSDAAAPLNVLLLRFDRRDAVPFDGLSYIFDERVPHVLEHFTFDLVGSAAHLDHDVSGSRGVVSAVELPNEHHSLFATAAARAARRFIGWLPPAPSDGGHDVNRTGEAAMLALLMRASSEAPLTTRLSHETTHTRTAGCAECPGAKPERLVVNWAAESLEVLHQLQGRTEAGMGNVLLTPPVTTVIRGYAPGADGRPIAVRLLHDAFLNRGYLYLVMVPYDVAGIVDPRDVEVTVVSPAQPPGAPAHASVAHLASLGASQTPSNLRSTVMALRHPAFEAPDADQVTVRLRLNDTFFKRTIDEVVVVRRSPLSRSGSMAACTLMSFDQGLLRLWASFHRLVGVTDFYIYYHGEASDPRLPPLMRKLQRLRGVRATFIPMPIQPYWVHLAKPKRPQTTLLQNSSTGSSNSAAVFDDASADGSDPTLRQEFGPATPSHKSSHHHVQPAALASCMYRFHHRHDAMVFIDVDELLVPGPGRPSPASAARQSPAPAAGATTLPQLLERLPLGWQTARMRMAWAKLMPAALPRASKNVAGDGALLHARGSHSSDSAAMNADHAAEQDDDDLGLEHLLSRRLMRLPSTNHDVRMKVIFNTRCAAMTQIDAAAARAAGPAAMKAQEPAPFLMLTHFILPAETMTLGEADIVMLHLRNRRFNQSAAAGGHEDDLIESHPLAMEERRPLQLLAHRGLASFGD